MTSEKPKEQLTRARRVAFLLATSTTIMLLSLVFALIQRTEAKKLLEQTVELQRENDKLKMELQQTRLSSIIAREEAMRQAELARKEFEAQTKNKR